MRLREQEMPLDPTSSASSRRSTTRSPASLSTPTSRVWRALPWSFATSARSRAPRWRPGWTRLAADGFPPRAYDRLGRVHRGAADAFRPLRDKGTRRLVPALGAVSVFVVAIGIGISQSGVLGGDDTPAARPRCRRRHRRTGAGPASAAVRPLEDGSSAAQAPARRRWTLRPRPGPRRPRSIKRKVAQEVDLGLSTAPDDFRDAADGVLDVVGDHRGFVVRSNVSGGDPGVAGAERGRASFALRIPAGELSATMGDLSDLGHVVSRSDGTVDVTDRFVSAQRIGSTS